MTNMSHIAPQFTTPEVLAITIQNIRSEHWLLYSYRLRLSNGQIQVKIDEMTLLDRAIYERGVAIWEQVRGSYTDYVGIRYGEREQ